MTLHDTLRILALSTKSDCKIQINDSVIDILWNTVLAKKTPVQYKIFELVKPSSYNRLLKKRIILGDIIFMLLFLSSNRGHSRLSGRVNLIPSIE